ncbi:MAG TPA: cyclopropane-fatty-acyl-phospholipid synthase family protein [Usitatibacter sp.]|nr:cyclopropane-fatty-acyl-phospholipid synthase family protein [Usitatibacter sp.]
MNGPTRLAIDWVEQGLVPDAVIRSGIRRLCEKRLATLATTDAEAAAHAAEAFVRSMNGSDAAPVPHLANRQHYEVPAAFFEIALGPHRKYSSAWWPQGVTDLATAEALALAATCERAALADGQDILELGCGWGSLSLWMAERFPASRITALSNSTSQRDYILARAGERRLGNLEVITADMNRFDTVERFDRVVSVEMFEHMRNWRVLFDRVHGWLRPGGLFFMHVFCHRTTPYAFVDDDPSDWMSRHFFSGGMMPSDELALRFQESLRLAKRWRWDGTHYEKTANAWLANLDARQGEALAVLATSHGEAGAALWLQRWRIFFMACAELFGYRGGQEWWVSHYVFERPAR